MLLRNQIGPYRLLRRIGVGGMAEVYEAEQSVGGAGKRVAVKVLAVEADDPEQQQLSRMFLDEARLAAGLSHANIVSVFDCGQVDDLLYIAMEYVDGWDLRRLGERWVRAGVLHDPVMTT